ncbi:MAG: hypothetical protein KME26_20105 [Oscillatoria princeps RMCB-10]|nr:hypothetical protein [Oscillatoria princeps RMCB-10]
MSPAGNAAAGRTHARHRTAARTGTTGTPSISIYNKCRRSPTSRGGLTRPICRSSSISPNPPLPLIDISIFGQQSQYRMPALVRQLVPTGSATRG